VQAAPSQDEGTVTSLPARLRRQIVSYSTREAPGTVIIDTPNTYLYYVLGGGQAIRYGIGVGRDGFTWSGVQSITKKAEWPDWTPPPEMIARQPYLPRQMARSPRHFLFLVRNKLHVVPAKAGTPSHRRIVLSRLEPHRG
jgi:lipoprotein-anchoring transpeptidase ErfK/SrfK